MKSPLKITARIALLAAFFVAIPAQANLADDYREDNRRQSIESKYCVDMHNGIVSSNQFFYFDTNWTILPNNKIFITRTHKDTCTRSSWNDLNKIYTITSNWSPHIQTQTVIEGDELVSYGKEKKDLGGRTKRYICATKSGSGGGDCLY